MIGSINSAIKSGHGEAVLYAGALGLLISDILPTPADSLYFYFESKNKEKLNKGDITPKQYWTRDVANYYLLNPLWWSLVLGAMVLTKGDVSDKAKVGLTIVAGGALIGVIYRNIRRDELLQQQVKK